MTSKKKLWIFISMLYSFLCCPSCSSNNDSEPGPPGEKIIISQIKDGNGRKILEVDGKPFFLLGTQIRLDGLMDFTNKPVEILDKYVAAAKKLGVTYVRIPIEWKDVEPKENVYDFSQLGDVLSICKKYNMKMELMWPSVNMCGEAMSCMIPLYIWSDSNRFPRYHADTDNRPSSLYGFRTQLIMSNTNLREREKLVVEKMMDYIYSWEEGKGFPKVIIGIQVYNEADLFLDRRNLYNYQVTPEAAWNDILASMGYISQVFKAARYNVVTNTNMAAIKGDGLPGRTDITNVKRIFDLNGIDYVTWDPYKTSQYSLGQDIGLMKKHIPETLCFISENAGNFDNTDRLLLSVYAKGCGYNIYDLSTPPYFVEKLPSTDQGILEHTTLTDRPHTESVRRVIKALTGTGHIINRIHIDNFAVFNLHEETTITTVQQTIKTTTATISFSTTNGAIGFALVDTDYITVYVSQASTVKLSNGKFSECQKGYYQNEQWVAEGDVSMDNDYSFNCEANTLYRIKVESITAPQTSNTNSFNK